MPNRILRDWTDSETIDKLDVNAERFFTRLIMKVDDFGRYSANNKLLKSHLFPLKSDIRETDISRWLTACEESGLIALYNVANKEYLQIANFKQVLRQKKEKFPAPEGCNTSATHPHSIRVPETKRNESETETKDVDDARENFLSFKSVLMQDEHYRETCCVSSKITNEQFQEAIDEYFEKKVALREYEGMTRKDVRKNFMYWLSGWLERQRKPQEHRGKGHQNGKSKLQNLISVNQEVKNSFDGIDD